MKRNHIKAISLINQAIAACGEDFALGEARGHLRRALVSVNDVGNKRVKRKTKADEYAEIAKNKHNEWWKMIVEGAKKSAEANLGKQQPDEDKDAGAQ